MLVGNSFEGPARRTPLDRAAQAFAEVCSRQDAPMLDGRAIGGGLPPRRLAVGEVAELLPVLDGDGRDAVWRELVRLSRQVGAPWPTVAVGLALPGLRTTAARLARGAQLIEDLDAELVAAFFEALVDADVGGSMVCAELRSAAYNKVRRIRYQAIRDTARTVGLEQVAEQPAPAVSSGHPDFVLAEAIRAGVLDRDEAELIGASRLEGIPLTVVADRIGAAVTTAWYRRKCAEARLVAWIRDGKA